MTYSFGLIGCGMIARFHAKAINDLENAKLAGCWNRTSEKTHQLANEFGGTAYESLETMLANPEIQVVCICTASGAHMEPAVAAAEAGKHVLVEKPLEITLDRCDRIIAACEANNVGLATIFPSRFHDSSQAFKTAIDGGRFGRLTLGDAYVKWHRTQEYYDSGEWRGTWELDGGGALMNQAIHSVDLLQWMMGPVRRITAVTATLAHERIAVEDTAVATLEFANGALGVIEATTAAYPGYLKRIEIHGSQGSAMMEEEDIVKWDFGEQHSADRAIRDQMNARHSTAGGASDPAAIGHHGHTRLFADFLASLEQGRASNTDSREGRKSVEIILAIYQAAETGCAVALPLTKDPDLAARVLPFQER
ncbi:MAG: Gfo/Idh/MocA family oxidoreductase [Pirellulales bacterium]|nr:Gfo/Idh/MocA family oxidoreductase [Pirellulales bacterium]